MKGKEEAELWLVGCVSVFGVPIEASSEGQGLEQRERKVREPPRDIQDWTWRQKRCLGQGIDLSVRKPLTWVFANTVD